MPEKSGPLNILVLASGNGSNFQSLIDNLDRNKAKLSLLIIDRASAYAAKRARLSGIPFLLEKPDYSLKRGERRVELSNRILKHCRHYKIDMIVHAGFLSVLSGEIIEEYAWRMINIHPALLPKYGGQGMYGENVHRAVLEAGERESGCTVHYVTAGIDAGPVVLQKKVPVLPDDNADLLAKRIQKQEHFAIVEAVNIVIDKIFDKNCLEEK